MVIITNSSGRNAGNRSTVISERNMPKVPGKLSIFTADFKNKNATATVITKQSSYFPVYNDAFFLIATVILPITTDGLYRTQ